MARLGVPVGGRVRKPRAVGDLAFKLKMGDIAAAQVKVDMMAFGNHHWVERLLSKSKPLMRIG
jgi:hypothetical protein